MVFLDSRFWTANQLFPTLYNLEEREKPLIKLSGTFIAISDLPDDEEEIFQFVSSYKNKRDGQIL